MLANIDGFVTLEWINCDKSRRPQHREWLPNLSRQIDCHWHITDSYVSTWPSCQFESIFMSLNQEPTLCHAQIQTTVPIQNASQDS